jgi:hypothetical protein
MDPVYEIDFTSQLAKAQRRSELNSLMTGLSLVGQIAQFDPAVIDKVSPDRAVDEAWQIIGAPERVLRDDEELGDLRQAKADISAAQQQMEMIAAGADAAQKGSQADLNKAKAREAME